MSKIYIVILAGGKGERLWPLSRESMPKQVLDMGGTSLLLETIERSKAVLLDKKIWIVTTKQQKELIEKHVAGRVDNIIVEPASRNTAPAMLLTCLMIEKESPGATVVFLPADHYIEDKKAFQATLKDAISLSWEANYFVLIGIKPTYAATGYGYISYNENKPNGSAYQVNAFREKPSKVVAQTYCKQENMLWNSGIVVGNVHFFLKAFEAHVPEMYQVVALPHLTIDQYEKIPSISFDYAVLEHSDHCLVIPAAFAWSDVGNLETFLTLKQAFAKQELIEHESSNNLVDSDSSQMIVLVGVHNLCVVQKDDVLLIVNREETEHIKNVVALLKKRGKQSYL